MVLLGLEKKYKITVYTIGGGLSGQSDAIESLLIINNNYKKPNQKNEY